MTDSSISYDKVSCLLRKEDLGSKQLRRAVKPLVRKVECNDGCLIIDDCIEEKPYTDESEIVQWYYEHSKGRILKGICLVNVLYCSIGEIALPISYEIVKEDRIIKDILSGQDKAVSSMTKNELYRKQLQI